MGSRASCSGVITPAACYMSMAGGALVYGTSKLHPLPLLPATSPDHATGRSHRLLAFLLAEGRVLIRVTKPLSPPAV